MFSSCYVISVVFKLSRGHLPLCSSCGILICHDKRYPELARLMVRCMQVFKCVSAQVCKYVSMHVRKYASVCVCTYARVQVTGMHLSFETRKHSRANPRHTHGTHHTRVAHVRHHLPGWRSIFSTCFILVMVSYVSRARCWVALGFCFTCRVSSGAVSMLEVRDFFTSTSAWQT